MTKAEKAKLYMEYLEQEGYRPSISSEGNVIFKADGLRHLILIDDKDEEYFAIMLFIWDIENSEDLARALRAANTATRDTKVAKVHVTENGKDVYATIEMYISPPEGFARTCERCIRALKFAADKFVQQMTSEQPKEETALVLG
jgi:hypothetical protein